LQANGKTEKISFFRNPKIYPGSQIVLILKDRKEWYDLIKDNVDKFVSIFSILTASLTTILLITKL